MGKRPKIPIRNIYYMLSYAWNILEQSETVNVGSEEFDNIYNLLSRIYINGINNLRKRGLVRYYMEKKELVSTLRGKIDISSSIKEQSIQYGKMVCSFDEFSEDIILNQIIKTTITLLIKAPDLDKNLRDKLLKQQLYFSGISEIRLTESLFSSLRYNRNNKHYQMLINISELIYKGLITKEKENKYLFSDFIRDEQMAKLYEKFVLNFYKSHLDESIYKVHAPKLNWDIEAEVKEEDLLLLPEMRTDIVVENKVEEIQMIIDTKYYSKTLVKGNRTDIERVRTGHLYQIFAYISNSQYKGKKEGILLYPTIDKDIDAIFPITNKKIMIKTLNLNTEWENVEKRLISIIN